MTYNGEDMIGMSEKEMREQDRAFSGTVNSLVSCQFCGLALRISKMGYRNKPDEYEVDCHNGCYQIHDCVVVDQSKTNAIKTAND